MFAHGSLLSLKTRKGSRRLITARLFHVGALMEASRARRIRDLLRMKAKAVRLYGNRPFVIKLANHLAHCVSQCCANQRKWEGPTVQERRAFLAEAA